MLGQRIYSTSQHFQPGTNRFLFSAHDVSGELASGVYYARLGYDGKSKNSKIMFVK
ncbi:T9SS type A sorting domain-containing protein [bacterium]|nr:T9SS type A sorting domain-containing protein [bacterium]